MVDVTACPICHSTEWLQVLEVGDHFATKEKFQLQECAGCSLISTNPRPSEESLALYYQSPNYISHSGKGDSLIGRLYLAVRKYSLKWKLNLVNDLKVKGNILDVGCGTGEFLNILKKDNWTIEGVEPNSIARQKASLLTSTRIHESFNGLTKTFDVITLWHVLEHLPNLDESLKNISDRLNKDGLLLIAVPNYKSWDAQRYKEYWAAYDVPRHVWHFNRQSMVSLLQKYGFSLTKIIPMKLDAYYVSMLSEEYKGNNSTIVNFIRGFFNGMSSNQKAKRTGEYSSLIYISKR